MENGKDIRNSSFFLFFYLVLRIHTHNKTKFSKNKKHNNNKIHIYILCVYIKENGKFYEILYLCVWWASDGDDMWWC